MAVMEDTEKQEIIIEEIPIDKNKEKNEEFVLYAGVEEAFDIETERNTEEKTIEDDTVYLGWSTARVNIREKPNMDSEVLNILEFNEVVEFQLYNSDWVVIQYNNKPAYVYKKYISKDGDNPKVYSVPSNRGFKSYMSYETITNRSSKQYKLQRDYAYTGNYGIRMIHNRYCIALGTYFNAPLGTYVDLELKNGTIISCIVAEIKSDRHTDSDNIVTSHNGCVSEFLVDTKVLNSNAKRDGDISSCRDEWSSPVVKIKVYNKNIL
jgi:hypothetical protein